MSGLGPVFACDTLIPKSLSLFDPTYIGGQKLVCPGPGPKFGPINWVPFHTMGLFQSFDHAALSLLLFYLRVSRCMLTLFLGEVCHLLSPL